MVCRRQHSVLKFSRWKLFLETALNNTPKSKRSIKFIVDCLLLRVGTYKTKKCEVEERLQLSHILILMRSRVKQVVLNRLGVKLPIINSSTRKIAFHSSNLLIYECIYKVNRVIWWGSRDTSRCWQFDGFKELLNEAMICEAEHFYRWERNWPAFLGNSKQPTDGSLGAAVVMSVSVMQASVTCTSFANYTTLSGNWRKRTMTWPPNSWPML